MIKQLSDRIGRQTPNKHVFNENYTSLYDNPKVANSFKKWGLNFLPWQSFVIRDCLALNSKGNIGYRNVGLSTMRQQGKSEIIIGLILFFMVYSNKENKENILYSSYHGSSSDAIFDRLIETIKKNKILRSYFPDLPSAFSKNKELTAYDPMTGVALGKVLFQTRRGGAGRGGTYSKIFFDEAQKLTEAEHDSYAGTTITLINGQIYYFGTPSTFEDSGSFGRGAGGGTGEFFLKIRRSILNGEARNSCWNEWGVSEIPRDRYDKEIWYDCIPSLGFSFGKGKGITEETLESFVGSDESFATEYLGYWASQAKERAIDITTWRQLEKEDISLTRTSKSKIGLAIKNNSAEDSLYVAVAIRDVNDNIIVELLKQYDLNENWINSFWNDLGGYFRSNKVVNISIDGGYAKSVIQNFLIEKRLWKANGSPNKQGKIVMVSARDLGFASSGFISLIKEGRIIHGGQYLVDAAIEDAKKRQMRGDSGGFAFASMSGKVDVTPLEVIALAVNGVLKNSSISKNSESSDILSNNRMTTYNVSAGLSGWN